MDTVMNRLAAGLSLGTTFVTVLTDSSLTIDWISPSVVDSTGWSAEALIGRNAVELVHPDDLGGVARLLAAETRDPHPYAGDPARRSVNSIRFLDAQGGWTSFDVSSNNQIGNPAVGGFVFIMAPNAERRLHDEFYDSLMAGVPLETSVQCVAELLSWQTDRSLVRIELHCASAVTAGVSVPGRCLIESVVQIELAAAGTISVEYDASVPPSEWFVVLLERAVGLLRIAITRHLGEQAMRRRLDEKSALISAVSHDLRSPIAAIQLMSSLLDGSSDALSGDQRRELIRRMNADARRTARLLADLTSLDRLLHGSGDVVLQRVSVRGLIERVLGELDTAERDVFLAGGESGLAARANPVLLERIIDNLIGNAVKHTSVGSRVEVSVEAVDGHELVVHVDDDGPGVPREMWTTMFDPYVRGSGSSHATGTGMGLFLVRTFADVQAGRAMCGVSPMGGARLSVVLPRWTD